MESLIKIKTSFQYGKTVCDEIFYSAPYKINALQKDGNTAVITIMSSSAGLLKGDNLVSEFDFGDSSDVKIKSQSYEKVFDSEDGKTCKLTRINCGENAKVKYLPYPAILFKNSCYENRNEIELAKNSELYFSDIFSVGRIYMDEKFQFSSYSSKTKITLESKLVFYENTSIKPNEFSHEKMGLYGEFTHGGILYIYKNDSEKLREIIDYIRGHSTEDSGLMFAVSKAIAGICIRTLGFSGDEIYKFHEEIASI